MYLSFVKFAKRKQLGSKQSWRVSLSPGRGYVGRFIPGRFPQKYRARWAADISRASTTTGLHCEGVCMCECVCMHVHACECVCECVYTCMCKSESNTLPCTRKIKKSCISYIIIVYNIKTCRPCTISTYNLKSETWYLQKFTLTCRNLLMVCLSLALMETTFS